MTESIDFAKLSGSGNDFICIDARDGRLDALFESGAATFAAALCRRGRAVGADGLILAVRPEVEGFADMARLQLQAWEVPGEVLSCSLYELDVDALWQRWDLLYVPGVLYHLTDPLVALVIFWALLRPGGVVAFESITSAAQQGTSARYLGARLAGWNYWAPAPATFEAMLEDAGFAARTVELSAGRGWWVGRRRPELPVLSHGAAGFSRPDLLRAIRARLDAGRRSR